MTPPLLKHRDNVGEEKQSTSNIIVMKNERSDSSPACLPRLGEEIEEPEEEEKESLGTKTVPTFMMEVMGVLK